MRLISDENFYDNYDVSLELVQGKGTDLALIEREAYNIPHPEKQHENHARGEWDEGDYLQREICINTKKYTGNYDYVSNTYLEKVTTLTNSGYKQVDDRYINFGIYSGINNGKPYDSSMECKPYIGLATHGARRNGDAVSIEELDTW